MTMTYTLFSQINSLEEFSLIGGNTYTLTFNIFAEDGFTPVDLSGASTKWVLSPYGQEDYNILNKTGTITATNTFTVLLAYADTISLSGKYIHQPIITSFAGSIYKPAQGIVLVIPAISLT